MFKWIRLKRKQKEFLNLMAKMKMEKYYLVDMKEFTNGYRLIIGIYAGGSISEFTKHKEELDNYFKENYMSFPKYQHTFIKKDNHYIWQKTEKV